MEATRPRLIAFTGQKGHGKDTAAAALPHKRINFADPLKGLLSSVLGVEMRYFEDPVLKETVHEPSGLPYRVWMQRIGMAFREEWPDVWVNAWKDMVGRSVLAAQYYDDNRDLICTDVRFPNEAQAVKEMGGSLTLIYNPHKADLGDPHPSETGVYNLPYDSMIVNSGTKDDLHTMVRSVLNGKA